MKIIHEISEQYTKRSPVVLTLGFFDGVHLGHQKIFKTIQEERGQDGQSVALTFENHPSSVIKPERPLNLINPLEQRIKLLKEQQVDLLILLPFTEGVKNTSCDEFIMNLHEHIPFDHLVLGPDSTIGHKKEGDAKMIKLLSKKYSFEFTQVDFVKEEGERISSTRVRACIEKGDFALAKKLLGRTYTLECPVIKGEQIGQILGFPTLNLEVTNLALPPLGVYKVYVIHNNKKHLAIANVGYAPTVQERREPVLEVHLLSDNKELHTDFVEVEFDSFIREEKKFSSIDALKEQIALDIESIQ